MHQVTIVPLREGRLYLNVSASVDTGDPEQDEILLDAFRGGEDENHFTAGLSFGTPVNFYVQLAADLADTTDQYVVSAIWRFGKHRR